MTKIVVDSAQLGSAKSTKSINKVDKMKKETYKRMLFELSAHNYSTSGEYDIERLFKIYTETEITKYADLFNMDITRDFKNFVLTHVGLMKGLEKDKDGEIQQTQLISVRSLTHKRTLPFAILNDKLFSEYKVNQEKFTKDVEKLIGNEKLDILDVGSGQIPYSSILLAKDTDSNISTMDRFVVSNKTLENLNCTPYDAYFDSKTSVDKYDFVIANRACSAIEHIVSNCATKKKPYLIKLCGCNAPSGTVSSWEEYLKHIDPNIQFTNDDYALNLDL